MTNVADYNMSLNFTVNSAELLTELRTMNTAAYGSFNEHVKSYERYMNDIMDRRTKIESKFHTPEEVREEKTRNLLKLQQELNLSDRAYYGLLKEITVEYEKAAGITARQADTKDAAIKKKMEAQGKLNSSIQTQNKIRAQQQAILNHAQEEENRLRQRALNLTHRYETEEQRLLRTHEELTQAYFRGSLSVDEYHSAVNNLNRAQQQVQGNFNRTGYAISNLATGAEDFVTVMAQSGFRLESFAAGARAASNNVGQAIRTAGGAFGGLHAAIFSVGTILVGMAIPALYKWIVGTEDAEKATKRLEDSIASLQRIYNVTVNDNIRQAKFGDDMQSIVDIDSVKEAEDKLIDLDIAFAELKNNITKSSNDLRAVSDSLWNQLIPAETINDFNEAFNLIGKVNGQLERAYRDELSTIQEDFTRNFTLLDPKEALSQMERDLRSLTDAMFVQLKDSGLLQELNQQMNVSNVLPGGGMGVNNFMANVNAFFDDAAVIDAMQAILDDEEKLGKLASENNATREEYSNQLQAQVDMMKLIVAAQEQINVAAQKEADIRSQLAYEQMQQNEEELFNKKEDYRRKTLRGAEADLFDLAKERRELLESGIASPGVLEGLFDQGLQGKLFDLEKQLAVSESYTAGSSSLSSTTRAVTDANKQISANLLAKPEDEARKEMLKLVKGIRDHLTRQNVLQVEVIP